MTRPCSICAHAEREAIDAALVAGEPYRDISGRFGVSRSALTRHKAQHIGQAVAQAQGEAVTAAGGAVLAKIAALEADAKRLQAKAEKSGDYRTAIAALREMVRIVELLAKLQGELTEGTTINILVNPQWLTIRAVIVAALAGYPEARARVVEALARVGA